MLARRRNFEFGHLAASYKTPVAYDVVRDDTQKAPLVASRFVDDLDAPTHLKSFHCKNSIVRIDV